MRFLAVFAAILLAFGVRQSAAQSFPDAAFPLHVSSNGKYLEDASGRPFLIHGDTAWSLIAELTREEAELYLRERKRQGFNAILVNLIEHQFSSNPPANAYGDKPFDAAAFATLNARYFEHASWVVRRAGEMGFLVFLAPAYLGANGSAQGWYVDMEKAGAETLHRYGRELAARFSGFDNIVWVHGGDFDAPDKALVSAVARGIKENAPDPIQTVHANRDTPTVDEWAGESWFDLDTVYTYDETHPAVLARTKRAPPMPVLMIEGLYEGEHGTDEETMRRQAYGSLLAGAAGQLFGNNPIWHFSGQGLYEAGVNWREALKSRGAASMTYLRTLFEGIRWWELQPDREGLFAAADSDRAIVAALTPDRSLGLAYLSGVENITLQADKMPGKMLEASWFDPATGEWASVQNVPPDGRQAYVFMPPSPKNGAGFGDWVLVVKTRN